VFRQPHSVDVIIPVYGAAGDLWLCLESVARHTDLERHRVVIVLDGPQDDAVEAVVAGRQLLRNPTRLGFVKSANRGMRESTNDVVLLNSDTIVTANWLEKLIDAAYSSDRIATVTPLSNNATICTIAAGHDLDAFAAHVERVSQRDYPRLPTAVGFCMYIRRAALDEIGDFDEESFGLGYGEENDFCMRASARAWEHVADDATFIHHTGERSFGTHSHRSAQAALTRKHPGYMRLIAEFMRRDPLAPVRARIESLRIVHLVHGWPPFAQAGTELYAYWLVRRQRERHHVAVYTRTEGETRELLDDGVRVRLVKNDFTTRNPLRRNALIDRAMERDFARFLREEKPDLLHVHHLAGHAFSLVRVAKRLRIPVVMQIQDWWFLCARVNLFDGVGRCSGPEPAKCARCVTLTKLPGNRALHALRRIVARSALRAADAYIAGSNAIRDDYTTDRRGRLSYRIEAPFHVIPYGIAIEPSRPQRTARKPIRFGIIGSSGPHKGRHIAIEAMRDIDPSEATLSVFEHFEEADKPRIFESMDVLLMPSIGLESFGLAAREAMACGVPVIATSGGAMDELPEAQLVPPGDAVALRNAIRRLIDDPSIIDAWSARLPVPKSDREHAEEIERVYRTVL
jgi:GT2 family glycosyltransferase/glycosyltransferase involved in cell wall biosynthesis